jgi:hypothetical protein
LRFAVLGLNVDGRGQQAAREVAHWQQSIPGSNQLV